MIERVTRAVKADASLYEEVERNPALTTEAYTIVGIVALVAAVLGLTGGISGAIASAIGVVVSYLLWTFVTYFVGTNLFDGKANWQEMQRTIAYALVPSVLGGFAGIPLIGWLIAIVGSLWTLYLVYVAIRQGLDLDSNKAILTGVISWIAIFVVNLLLQVIF
ncbi:MAG: YIP1 family protein [Anaerolineales bacterium]|nr:YIP1 family protein [Anaerolineales bacterium]MCB9126760.1 YIP1 family protein [Ardenticatenales bacterium]